MRNITLLLLFPAAVTAQAQSQPAPASRTDWARQVAAGADRHDSDRATRRVKVARSRDEADRREEALLALIRDFARFAREVEAIDRAAAERERLMRLDDSSAARDTDARRSGNPSRAAGAMTQRLADVRSWVAQTDSALKDAKNMSTQSLRMIARLKDDGEPRRPPTRRDNVGRHLDYYETVERVGRARATFYSEYSDMFRREIARLESEVAGIPGRSR